MPITLIAGGGMAGRACALTLRRVGYQGEIVLVGDETTPPYDRPPLSKSVIVGTADLEKVVKPGAEAYAEDGVDLRLGTSVASVDGAARTATLSDGSTVAWDALVLATGCAPRSAPIAGIERAHRVTRMDEALAIHAILAEGPKRVAVIGGGFIGLEAALAAVGAGHTAVVLEGGELVMQRPLGGEVAARVQRWAEARGAEIRTGVLVEEVVDGAVRLAGGEEIAADLVLCAIGQEPRLDLARQLGCEEAAGGVEVDRGLRTSVEGVYAVGDIAGFPSRWADEDRIRVEHAGVAIGHGQVAAEQIATGEGQFDDLPTFWSDQGDVTLNVIGTPRADHEIVWRGDQDAPACTAFYLRDGQLRAALSAGDMKSLRGARKLFAAGVSPSADQLADPDVNLADLAAG